MDSFQILLKKRILQNPNRSLKQRIMNFSTTSISNIIYPSYPSTTNNSNYEEQIKKLEAYSKYHFNNNQKYNIKSELSLLKNGINSIINDNNSNYHIKLSPIKKKEVYKSLLTNRRHKKINFRNALLGNDKKSDNNNIKDSIWEKLKNSKSMKESYKYTRANIIQNLKKYEYMEKQRNITRIINICDVKKDQIKRIKKIYKNENKSLEKMKEKLKNSFERIRNVYDETNRSTSSFIFTTAMKESNLSDKLLIDRKELKKEAIEIERKIKIFIEEKNFILNWVYLLIQMKENKLILPKYYIDILDKNISLNSFLKKYSNLKKAKEEYKRIYSYKINLVFSDLKEFDEKFNGINQKILMFLDSTNKILKNKNLNDKQKLNEMIEEMKPSKEEPILQRELDDLKETNQKLKEIYTYRYHLNKNKKQKNFKRKIYLYITKLYEEFKKLKFNKTDIIINFYDREEKIIIHIIECFEMNLNYLLEEKNKYYSNDELRDLYKKEEMKIKKEKIYLNVLKQQKINQQKLEEKYELIEKRIGNRNFLPNKKIDFDYYMRAKHRLKQSDRKEEDEAEINRQYIFYS